MSAGGDPMKTLIRDGRNKVEIDVEALRRFIEIVRARLAALLHARVA
jgi:hypothetical protein